MKAIRVHQYGPADVLQFDDIPQPEPGVDEVLIRTIATSVNPVDCKFREGWLQQMMPMPLPMIPGWEASGIVASAGNDASRFKPGDAVYTMPAFGPAGTYAEYFVAKASQVALKPRTISFIEAAALPMTAQTAWMAMVTVGAVEAGQRVLIHGATGGVGSLAVQIAKSRGAFVVGTGSTHSRALAQSLGVDRFIDYRTESVKDAVSDIDVVLDTIGGQTQEDSYGVMRPGGILIATALPPSPERAEAAGVRAQFIFTASSGDVLDQISALVDSGKLRPIIGAELSLADAARAHQISQSGRAGGKIVLYVAMP